MITSHLKRISFVNLSCSTCVCLFACILVTGCSVSYHYVGYLVSEDKYRHGFVSRKTEEAGKEFEVRCMKALLGESRTGLNELFTNRLLKSITRDSLALISSILKQRYLADGYFRVLENGLNLRSSIGDRVLRKNGFEHYDFIQVSYLVQGKKDARVELFITEIYKELKLCGIKIRDMDYAPLGERFEIQWLAPEPEEG
ncbi:hypothetical protein ACFL5V_10195 [Fibrobacterota bacterium]